MELFNDHLVVSARTHPGKASTLRRWRDKGLVWSPLPGTFTPHPDGWDLRIAAAVLWGHGLVLAGEAAARLTWNQQLEPTRIHMLGGKRSSPVPWLRISQNHLPDTLIWEQRGVRAVAAEVSAIQMAMHDRGALFDAVRMDVSVEGMLEALALMPKFAGKPALRQLLQKSKDRPFSPLEILAHEELRQADITGWKANAPIRVGGKRYCADLLFDRQRLIIELDGWRFHSSHESFIEDRVRQNDLVLAGWTVLRYTHETLGDLVGQVCRALHTSGG